MMQQSVRLEVSVVFVRARQVMHGMARTGTADVVAVILSFFFFLRRRCFLSVLRAPVADSLSFFSGLFDGKTSELTRFLGCEGPAIEDMVVKLRDSPQKVAGFGVHVLLTQPPNWQERDNQ